MKGCKALVISTSYATLDTVDEKNGRVLKKGKPTGVHASELTEAYYTFLDAQMDVDVASIKGGEIPFDKLSLKPLVRTQHDSRFLKDPVLKEKTANSIPITEVSIKDYDVVFLAGGWGAAYDLAQSEILSAKLSEAYASKKILSAVCHGPLGFIGAVKPDGSALVEGVNITGVTNRQVKQLMIAKTPKHPETELKKYGANYKSKNGLVDMFVSHVEVDKKHLIVTGQNQKAGIEAAQMALELLSEKKSNGIQSS